MKYYSISFRYDINYVKAFVESDMFIETELTDDECVEVLSRVKKYDAFPSSVGFEYAIETVIKDRK